MLRLRLLVSAAYVIALLIHTAQPNRVFTDPGAKTTYHFSIVGV